MRLKCTIKSCFVSGSNTSHAILQFKLPAIFLFHWCWNCISTSLIKRDNQKHSTSCDKRALQIYRKWHLPWWTSLRRFWFLHSLTDKSQKALFRFFPWTKFSSNFSSSIGNVVLNSQLSLPQPTFKLVFELYSLQDWKRNPDWEVCQMHGCFLVWNMIRKLYNTNWIN